MADGATDRDRWLSFRDEGGPDVGLGVARSNTVLDVWGTILDSRESFKVEVELRTDGKYPHARLSCRVVEVPVAAVFQHVEDRWHMIRLEVAGIEGVFPLSAWGPGEDLEALLAEALETTEAVRLEEMERAG